MNHWEASYSDIVDRAFCSENEVKLMQFNNKTPKERLIFERYSQDKCRVSSGSKGAGGSGPRSSSPVKTSQKKDGRHTGPQILPSIGTPSDKFLDLLLIGNVFF